MRINYSTWKHLRRCGFLFELLISIPYIQEMEAFAIEEDRWRS